MSKLVRAGIAWAVGACLVAGAVGGARAAGGDEATVQGVTVTVAATKTVSAGPYVAGAPVTYTVVLANNSPFLVDDCPGPELLDLLPPELALVSASASAGTAVADTGTNTVTWDGALDPFGSVEVTIVATVGDFGGALVSNQGEIHFDTDGDGEHDRTAPTDDPGQPGFADPTVFTIAPGELGVAPAILDFGDVRLGDDAVRVATLANNGGASLQVLELDALAAPFAHASDGSCGSLPIRIAPGASCTIAYRFSPTAVGQTSQDATVTADVGSLDLALRGNGVVSALAVTPPVLDFGEVTLGQEARGLVTLTSTGTIPAGVTAIPMPAAPYALGDGGSCPAPPFTLLPGIGCTVEFVFAPVIAGPALLSLAIGTDAPGSPSIALQGAGVPAVLPANPTPQVIPAASPLGLLGLALVLALAGAAAGRRR